MPSTPLALSVQEFLGRLRRNPALASDPAFLDALATDASEDMQDAFVSLATPKCNDTWETTVVLPGASLTSPIAPIEFPKPVRIIGLHPVIVPVAPFTAGPVAVVNRATLDDVLISVSVDKETLYSVQEDSTTTATGPANFVTGSSLNVLLPRLFDVVIESSNPKIEFLWQWKQGANIFVDSICSIACFVQWRSDKTGRWSSRKARR